MAHEPHITLPRKTNCAAKSKMEREGVNADQQEKPVDEKLEAKLAAMSVEPERPGHALG
jgi:hypothetical protein